MPNFCPILSNSSKLFALNLNLQFGLKIVWEDKALQEELGLKAPPRFVEGDFNDYLAKI